MATPTFIPSDIFMMSGDHSTSAKKGESVLVATFKKWPFAKHFLYTVTTSGKVDNLKCIPCSERWVEIQAEASKRNLRGASLASLKQYVDGIHYVHRSNLERHCLSPYHQIGLKLRGEAGDSSDSIPASQPRIDNVIKNKSTTYYSKCFVTALWIAMEELPLVKFGRALHLQRLNGVNIPKGATDSTDTAIVMIGILANVVRKDIKEILSESHFMSGLSDGSEARKTREEKELIYVKVVSHGVPVTLFLKCQRMINFGGTDAVAVLKAVRDGFSTYDVDISIDGNDTHKIVSMCADGASTNMGVKRGALTVLKQNIPWLIIIHCSLHKLELAIKDGFKASKDFEEIDSHLVNLFKTFKDSGKCWRILLLLASKMGVSVRRFVKSQGTRFQSHKKSALDVFTYNFCLLLLFAENATETTGLLTPMMKARFQGFHKKWVQYLYPVRVCFYREVLQATTKLSLIIEKDDALLNDVMDSLEDCSDSLTDLLDNKWQKLPEVVGGYQCVSAGEDDSITMTVKATSAPSTLSLGNPSKLSDNQKRALEKQVGVTVTMSQEFPLKNVQQGKQAMARIQCTLIPKIKECVDERFKTMKSDPVLKAMRIVDQNTWDTGDAEFGRDQISTIAEHYKESLAVCHFDLDKSIQEWKLLMKITQRKYPTIRDKLVFWQKIFQNDSTQLTNILLIIEICLSIAVAQGMVERGFSLTRRILTDSRTKLKNETLDDLMVLRLNVPILKRVLGADYEESLICKSVGMYTQKRRCTPGVIVKRHRKSKSTQSHIKKSKVSPTTRDPDDHVVLLASCSDSSDHEEVEESHNDSHNSQVEESECNVSLSDESSLVYSSDSEISENTNAESNSLSDGSEIALS